MAEQALEIINVTKRFKLHKPLPTGLKETLTEILHQKKYGDEEFVALNGISLSINKGEAIGLIGKNGAGKSTLLRILSGILEPDEGEVRFYGKAVSILDIGAGFHPDLTGRENVFFSASLYGFKRSEVQQKLDAIIEFSAIGKFIDEPVKNYSSGMYVRLAFAIIVFLDADIFLIDEVISVGDADFQIRSKAKIEELVAKGKTLLVASHNLNEMAMLATRIVLIEEGKIVVEGGTDVVQQYVARALPQFRNLNNSTGFSVNNITGPLSRCPEILLVDSGIYDFKLTPEGISNKQAFKIFVELELLKPIEIYLALRFYDHINHIVFLTSTFKKNLPAIKTSGNYKVIFTIPSNILNKGLYTADLLLINDITLFVTGNATNTSLLHKTDKFISIKIADERTDSYVLPFPGVMKPDLQIEILHKE